MKGRKSRKERNVFTRSLGVPSLHTFVAYKGRKIHNFKNYVLINWNKAESKGQKIKKFKN